ncbi:multicopper oxidase domain-containing protein [Nocardia sp. NPDC023852]
MEGHHRHESVRSWEIAVRFTDHAGTYMRHCHNPAHEDMAMIADYVTEE